MKKSELAILYLEKVNAWLSIEKNRSHRNYQPFSIAQKALSNDSIILSMRTLEKMQEILELKFNHTIIDNIDLTADDDDDEERSPNGCTSNSFRYSADSIKAEDPPNKTVEVTVSPIDPSAISSVAGTSHQPAVVDSLRFVAEARQQVIDLELEPSALVSQKVSLPALPPIEDLLESPPSALENVNPNHIVKKKVLVRRDSVCDPSTLKPNVPSISTYKLKTQSLVPPSVYAKPKNLEGGTRKITTVPYKKEPRAPEPAFDPKLEAIRLDGFKERIYAKDFLQFDAKAKMLKEELEKKAAEAAERAAEVDEKEKESDDEEAPPVPKKRRQSMAVKPEGQKKQKRQRRSTVKPVSSKKIAARSRSSEKSEEFPTRCRSREVCRVNRIESEDEDNYEVPNHVYDNVEHEMSMMMSGSNMNVTNFALNKRCDENDNILPTLSFLAENNEVRDEAPEPIASTSSAQSTPQAVFPTIPKSLSNARMSRSKSVAQASRAKINSSSSSSDNDKAALPTIPLRFSSARMTRSKSVSQASKAKIYSYPSSSDEFDDYVAPIRVVPMIRSTVDRTTDDQTDDAIEVLPPNKKKPVPIRVNLNKATRGKGKKRGVGRPKITNIVPQLVTTHFQAADFEASENVDYNTELMEDSDGERLLVEVPGKQKKIVRRETLVPKKLIVPKRRNAIDEKLLEIKIEPE